MTRLFVDVVNMSMTDGGDLRLRTARRTCGETIIGLGLLLVSSGARRRIIEDGLFRIVSREGRLKGCSASSLCIVRGDVRGAISSFLTKLGRRAVAP